jgi:hypothetical protein
MNGLLIGIALAIKTALTRVLPYPNLLGDYSIAALIIKLLSDLNKRLSARHYGSDQESPIK